MRLSPTLREDDFSNDRTFGRFARQVTALTPGKSAAFVNFCRVLLERQMRSIPENTSVEAAPPPPQQRVLGLHQGMGWMSEDFNQPLPDAFWLGEA